MSKATDAARKWLSEQDGNIQKSYAAVLKDEAALEAMGAGILRDADYTKSKQELAADRKKYESEYEELKAKRDGLAKWQEQAEGKYTKALNENADLSAFKVQAQKKLELLAERFQIPAEEIGLQMDATGQSADAAAQAVKDQGGVAAAEGAPGFDPEEFAGNMAGLNVQVMDVIAEHQEMFGERIKAEDFLRKLYASDGKSVRQVWESEYGVADKCEDLEEAAIQNRIDAATKKAVEEYRVSNPGSTPMPGTSPDAFRDELSPLLANEDIKKRLSHDGDNPIHDADDARIHDSVGGAVRMFEQRMAERAG
jgi:hypothetical protein